MKTKRSTPQSLQEAKDALDALDIEYKEQRDGTLVVPGDLYIFSDELTALPDLSCVLVEGDFQTSIKMKNLKGSPFRVEGKVWHINKGLTSLEGATQYVGGEFNCDENELVSLKGGPAYVGKAYRCAGNKLVTLEGAPEKIGGYFYCGRNKLKSLIGAPSEIGGYFSCTNNPVSCLEGVPRNSKSISSDLGNFETWSDVPEKFHTSPESQRSAFLKATDCRRGLERAVLVRRIDFKPAPHPAAGPS